MSQALKPAALLAFIRRKTLYYWHKAGLSRGQQAWLGFILLAGVGLFISALPQLTLFSAVVLVALLLLLGRAAWSWRAMQLSSVTLAVLSLLVIWSSRPDGFVVYLELLWGALLVSGVVLLIIVESARPQLTYRYVAFVYWSVIVSGLLLLVWDWAERPSAGLAYADLPLANTRDALLLTVVVMVFLYLLFLRAQRRVQGGYIALLPLTLTGVYLCVTSMLKGTVTAALPPAVLEHGLLLVHVPAMLIAFALLLNNAGFALLRLLSDTPWLKARQNRDVLETIHINLEDYLYRGVALAVVLLGIGLLTGMWWSNLAWGHYWYWDAKQVMSMAVWLYYLAGLHLRLQKGMQARAFAWWCAAGLPLLVTAFIGTNLWPNGLHDFGGL